MRGMPSAVNFSIAVRGQLPPVDLARGGVSATTSTTMFLRSVSSARRVQKVSVDAGFTCPNVDGTVAIGGCTFLRQPQLQPEPEDSAPEGDPCSN
jgi:hypothetical protein